MESTKLKFGGLLSVAAVVVLGLGWGLAGQSPPVNQPTAPLTPPVAGGPASPLPSAPPAIDALKPNAAAYRSANFVVYAPTPTQARVIANEAEHHRLILAKRWLGKELPKGNNPCVIHFPAEVHSSSTEFTFGISPPTVDKATFKYLDSARMKLAGPFERMLESELPHEVTHTVIAGHFGRALPRWADEGIAILSEPASELASHDVGVRKVLNEGKAFRLTHLFRLNEYPRDVSVLYFQGYSVVQFLLSRKPLDGTEFKPGFTQIDDGGLVLLSRTRAPHSALLEFVRLGSEGNTAKSWDAAAKFSYGFDSVDELETAWIEWLKRPKDKPTAPAALPTVPKEEKPELIPPTKLPGQ